MTLLHLRHLQIYQLVFFLILVGWQNLQGEGPVGDWDFVLQGRQRGVAHITFSSDGTLSGRAVHAAAFKKRAREGDDPLPDYGGAELQGSWTFENGLNNRIIGYMTFVADPPPSEVGISFRGVLRGRRLILRSGATAGRLTLRGRPLEPAADSSGVYYAKGRTLQLRNAFVEIFTASPMTNASDSSIVANSYVVTGGGPGYDYTGWLLVSGFKRAALYERRGVAVEDAAAFSGPFRVETGRGKLTGTDQTGRVLKLSVSPAPGGGDGEGTRGNRK